MDTNRKHLLAVLDFEATERPNSTEIHAAYRKALMKAHPDTGDGYAYTIDEIKDAHARLLSVVPNGDRTCPLCGGSGMVRFGFGGRECGTCNGTGEI